jgi:hypothetical protein
VPPLLRFNVTPVLPCATLTTLDKINALAATALPPAVALTLTLYEPSAAD